MHACSSVQLHVRANVGPRASRAGDSVAFQAHGRMRVSLDACEMRQARFMPRRSSRLAFGVARSSTERLAVDHRPTERPAAARLWIELANRDLELRERSHRHRLLPDAEDPCARAQSLLKGGTAVHNLVDLDQ